MGRKKPILPSPRCMDRLRSDMKEHQVDQKFAQKMVEELRKAIITIDSGCDVPRTGVRSAKGAACLCNNIFMTTQEHSPFYLIFSGKQDAAETAMHQSADEGAGGLPNRICKRKYDARRLFPFSIMCASSMSIRNVSRHLASAMLTCYVNCLNRGSRYGRCSIFLKDKVQLQHVPCPFSTRHYNNNNFIL